LPLLFSLRGVGRALGVAEHNCLEAFGMGEDGIEGDVPAHGEAAQYRFVNLKRVHQSDQVFCK